MTVTKMLKKVRFAEAFILAAHTDAPHTLASQAARLC